MNFATLKTELADRGFSYLSDTRRGQFINWARAELDSLHEWPYRQSVGTNTVPWTITDLGRVDTVTTNVPGSGTMGSTFLPVWSLHELEDQFGDLTVTGTPRYAYVDGNVLRTYPASTVTVSARFSSMTADLTGTDTPASPARFHEIIVDMAVRRAYVDSDNFEAAAALQREIDRKVAIMAGVLLEGVSSQLVTNQSFDW